MAMSFLALPVIPHLKLTDRGLVDVDAFAFTDVFVDELVQQAARSVVASSILGTNATAPTRSSV